jgi:putative membrane protein
MQTMTSVMTYQPSRLGRWFWMLTAVLIPFVLSIAAWNYVTALLVTQPILGWIATGLIGALLLVLLGIAVKELAGFSRLRRLDRLQKDAEAAAAADDHRQARTVSARIVKLYQNRPELAWGRQRFAELQGDALDAEALFALTEREYLLQLDELALRQVEAASRQVATVTALVPLALADVIVALTANLRMIRRIAEIYGGRAGALGSWRLTRSVLTHLVATGAVALGDDLVGSLAGGGLLSKLSRRFGEGIVNGALTARVGIAAIEVCRPLPFQVGSKPTVTAVVKRAVMGVFTSEDTEPEIPT